MWKKGEDLYVDMSQWCVGRHWLLLKFCLQDWCRRENFLFCFAYQHWAGRLVNVIRYGACLTWSSLRLKIGFGLKGALVGQMVALWMAIEMRWKWYSVSRGSPLMSVIRLPISGMSSIPSTFHGPPVSIATGMNMWELAMSVYLAFLAAAAASAAVPAWMEVSLTWDCA